MPDAAPNPPSVPKPRRWTIFAAALLLTALALVVIYTKHNAFSSPLAIVVVAAIGLAALMFQVRLRDQTGARARAPVWLNLVGLVAALGAVFADRLHLSPGPMRLAALAAVVCFAASGVVVLRGLRKQK